MMTDRFDDHNDAAEAPTAAFVARTIEGVIGQAVAQGVPLDLVAAAVLGVGARALVIAGGPFAAAAALRRMVAVAEAEERRRYDA